MTRRIFCEVCGRPKALHPDDVAMGWHQRHVHLVLGALPANHGFTVNGVFHPLSELVCETCDQPLKAGDKAIGWTMWREEHDGTPGPWELEYGKAQAQ